MWADLVDAAEAAEGGPINEWRRDLHRTRSEDIRRETMDHFWQNIEGYCTFPDFYRWLAKEVWSKCNSDRNPPRIVEVGVYAGASAACLAVELLKYGNGARLDLVDAFGQIPMVTVLKNLEPVIRTIGTVQQCMSWDGARIYKEDHTLDAVFIDADHTYAAVSRDIDAWLPKVKPGGIIAGHDFSPDEFPGVCNAVIDRFPDFTVFRGNKWGGNQPMDGKYYPVWMVRV